mgnify:FL=1|tara:strand:+ start:25 stop:495 length:471 start_codon:yes stop_codon:yes gene_type:complete
MLNRGMWVMSIREIAQRRHDIHKHHASSRPLSKDYELVGLSGEVAFAEFSGLEVDWEERPSGDKGIDFITPNGTTIDIKTARKAYNLIHEENKPFADIYVLAQYMDDTEESTLIGWEYGSILEKSPRKDFGYGIVNHYISKNKLNPMHALKKVCEI